MGKVRYEAGEKIFEMKILKILRQDTTYRDVVYLVDFPCGHTEPISGGTLVMRVLKLGRGKGTTKCPSCAIRHGRYPSNKNVQKYVDNKALSPFVALGLFPNKPPRPPQRKLI